MTLKLFNVLFNSKVAHHNIRLCAMCFEPGVRKRKCCNADYCDHCYTKDKAW